MERSISHNILLVGAKASTRRFIDSSITMDECTLEANWLSE
jgi:hypothetical protein